MSALQSVLARIASAAAKAGRAPESIRLLAVSKKQSPEAVETLFREGQKDFGENYVQEAEEKRLALGGSVQGSDWHLIGPLQSNKAKLAVQLFEWVHTVDRVSLAEKLDKLCQGRAQPLKVLVQVNTSGEDSKSGVAPDQALDLCRRIQAMPGLDLRGLMCIPEPQEDPEASRPEFRRLREMLHRFRGELGLPRFEELSMGMSADLEVAVEEGATIVRVGTALFGARPQT